MILLQGNDLARFFGAEVLFQHIHLEIHEQSRVALVGRNGAGKSTLLKIIAGIEDADTGTLSNKKNLKIGYLAQESGLNTKRSVWDEMLTVFDSVLQLEQQIRNLEREMATLDDASPLYEKKLMTYASLQQQFEDNNGYGYEADIRSILHGFQFGESFYTQSIATLSGGQKTRLALVKLLLEKPDLLILDEPTNHLDIATLNWLENYLQHYPGAILIVSHDRYFLDQVVAEVYELGRKKIQHFKGNYSDYLVFKEVQLSQEWKAFEKQQTEIMKLEEFVQKNIVRSSTTKRAQSRRKKLEKLERMDRPQGSEKSARFIFPVKEVSSNQVLRVKEGAIGYNETILSEPINLEITKKEAVAVVGPNGIGKSTLLKSIIEQHPFIKGETFLGANVHIGYYDQEQADLNSSKTVLAELWDDHPTHNEKDIRTILGNFLFSGEDVKKVVPALSGGEKARLALAKLAMQQENFLILDEPTNHLDIDSKEVLEEALIAYEGSLMFVSHDRYFINRIATKVVELSQNGSKIYLGDYDYYLEKKQEEEDLAAANKEKKVTAEETTVKQHFNLTKEQQRLERGLKRKILQVEEELTELETILNKLQQTMSQPEVISDHTQITDLTQQLQGYEQQQEGLLTEWETLSIELEEMD